MIAEGDEGRCGTRRRKDVGKHLGATARDDAEVADLGSLALGDVVPPEGDVFGSLPEAGFLGKGDGGFTV